MDYSNLCRTCLKSIKRNPVELTKSLYDYLSVELGVIHTHEEHPQILKLPQIVCVNCYNSLRKIQQFVSKCREVDTFFKLKLELLLKQNETVEDVEELDVQSTYEYDDTVYAESLDFVHQDDQNVDDEVVENFDGEDELVLAMFNSDNSEIEEIEISELATLHSTTEISNENTIESMYDTNNDENAYIESNPEQNESLCESSANSSSNETATSPDNPKKHTKPTIKKKRKKDSECGICGKRFLCPAHLRDHENIHKGVKPYCCDICGKCFTQRNTLVTHQTLHFGKPIVCDEPNCGKKFARKSQLILHDRMHRDEKPFTCDFENCHASFRLRTRLIEHQAKHLGIRKFRCDICDHTFFNIKGLRGHMYKIHPKFSYQCDICLSWHSKPSYIRKHFLTKHNLQVEDIQHLKKAKSAENSLIRARNYSNSD